MKSNRKSNFNLNSSVISKISLICIAILILGDGINLSVATAATNDATGTVEIKTNGTAAYPTDQMSGDFGTSHWELVSKGSGQYSLHFSAGDFANNDTVSSQFPEGMSPWHNNENNIIEVVFDGQVNAASQSKSLFGNFSNLKRIVNADRFNLTQATDISKMFNADSKLEAVDVSTWNTANVVNMDATFYQNSLLEVLDVSHWNTSKVTTMDSMFYKDSSVKVLDVSNWDTSNVLNMKNLFAYVANVKTINVSHWNTSKVKHMEYMFKTSPNGSAKAIDLSSFDMSNVLGNTQVGLFSKFFSRVTLGSGVYFSAFTLLGLSSYWTKTYWINLSSGEVSLSADLFNENYHSRYQDKGNQIYVSRWIYVDYVDKAGTQLAKQKIIGYGDAGTNDDQYTTSAIEIPGYQLVAQPTNASGSLPASESPTVPVSADRTVTYVYRKETKPVTVHYVDEKGKTIVKDKVLTGADGDAYQTEQLEISGYTYDHVDGSTTGNYSAVDQTVTYVYHKNTKPVTVHYVDENGNTISKDKVLTGADGDAYQTEQLKISGYSYDHVDGSTTGNYSAVDQTVTYVYHKNTKPEGPISDGDKGSNGSNGSTSQTVPSNQNHKLPQTDEAKNNQVTIIGAIILALSSIFAGLELHHKRQAE